MTGLFRDFAADRAGATSTEYALIAMFIAMAIFSSLVALGTNLSVPYVEPRLRHFLEFRRDTPERSRRPA